MTTMNEYDMYIDLAIKEFKELDVLQIHVDSIKFLKEIDRNKYYIVLDMLRTSDGFKLSNSYLILTPIGIEVRDEYKSWAHYKKKSLKTKGSFVDSMNEFFGNSYIIGIIVTVSGGVLLALYLRYLR